MINYLIITITLVFITDYAKFPAYLLARFSKWLGTKQIIHIKLLECSLCQTWWATIIYTLCAQNFASEVLVMPVVCAFSTKFLAELMFIVEDIFFFLVEKIRSLLK